MRVVVISRVKNEEDIIEPFVRHHCEMFDEIVILDDGSTDQTIAILRALVDEGLPVTLRSEEQHDNVQWQSMTRMMRACFAEGADWVVPLDADEFFEVTDRAAYDRLLASPRLVELPWNNFVFDDGLESDLNPVTRMTRHTPTRRWNYKVMVPSKLGARPDATLFEGNHFLYHGEKRINSERFPFIRLCHYPIRSVSQYSYKIIVGTARYAMLADPHPDWAYHYRAPFQALLENETAFTARMRLDSLNYGLAPSESAAEGAIEAPLSYRGSDLRYTPRNDRLVRNLAGYIHQLALIIAAEKRKTTASPSKQASLPFFPRWIVRRLNKRARRLG